MISNYNLEHPPIKTRLESETDTKHKLVIEPLLPGFGYTMGNSLRRIFLSSIPGFAITKVKINDLTHEYQPIESVKEDALDILLNIKNLRTKIITDEEKVNLVLKKDKEGPVTGKDFEKNASAEVINKDLYICHLNKGGELSIEIEITKGVGYIPLENRNLRGNTDPKGLLIDAIFTPVTNVSLQVDQVRVGDQTNFDKVNISFETDGSVEAKEITDFALKLSVDLNSNIYSSFHSSEGLEEAKTIQNKKNKPEKKDKEGEDNEIKLPARTKKILEKNGITTNDELKNRIDEVSDFAGMGEKTSQKVKDYLNNLK